MDVVPLLGAIVGCHCSVLRLRGRVTTNFGGVDVVPLQCAMVGRGEGNDQLRGSGRGAIAGCHCSVLWWGERASGGKSVLWLAGRVTTNFGGVDVPLQGANFCFISSDYF